MLDKIKKLIPLITLCLSLLLFLSSFFTVLKTDDNEAMMNGMKAIFGGEIAAFGPFLSANVKFSFPNLLAFFFPAIISIALAIYSLLDKEGITVKKILDLVIFAGFILSIVLIVMLPHNTIGAVDWFGNENTFTYEGAKLAIGAILGLIFAVLGFLLSAYHHLTQLLKK